MTDQTMSARRVKSIARFGYEQFAREQRAAAEVTHYEDGRTVVMIGDVRIVTTVDVVEGRQAESETDGAEGE